MDKLLAGAFMPHPPLIIPEVGERHHGQVAGTIRAMKAASERLVALNPRTVIVASPHGVHFNGAPSIAFGRRMEGGMEDFNAPGCRLSFPINQRLAETICIAAENAGISLYKAGKPAEEASVPPIDSGAFVPLYYLRMAGFAGDIVHICPGFISLEAALALGEAIAGAAAGNDAVLIGSGDLSHYLKDSPPYGLRPEGAAFDALAVEAIKENDPGKLLALDRELIGRAGECGLRSLLILLAAAKGLASNFYSYEDTFGVGYAVAVWERPSGIAPSVPARLARWSIENSFADGQKAAPAWADGLKERAGVFVSLKKAGALRGCIGTFLPQCLSVKEEILRNALSAAFSDPRFPPLSRDELPDLEISVDVLSPPEMVGSLSELDEKKYGVLVTDGARSGLLLPDLDGVNSVGEQLDIARQKAGIAPGAKVDVYRFTVRRYA
ncbi:MAG: AmmeMemoRadiSam system protein A [Acidaminococcales bacterium]|jgi:AmmeMemoRadiSam system protein A|nr:AmmeMemoRadiSam system protein A [Acidaminococcales bacterium]